MPTARELVMETTTKVTWYVDLRRWDEIADLFTDTVTVDYTSLNGGEPTVVNSADQVRGWRAGLGHLDATQHVISNHLVDVDEVARTATATAHFVATHLLRDSVGSSRWTLGGHYHWALRELDGRWRITSMTMTVIWADGNQAIMNPPPAQD